MRRGKRKVERRSVTRRIQKGTQYEATGTERCEGDVEG